MCVLYDNFNARGAPGVPFRSALFFVAPVQWIAPYGEDLAAGEAWRSTPDSVDFDLPRTAP